MAGAPSPLHSSVQLEAMYTSHSGFQPLASSSSTDCMMQNRLPLVSTVPRPHTAPSAMSPEKGSWGHSPSAATTSWWLIRRMGGFWPGAVPVIL